MARIDKRGGGKITCYETLTGGGPFASCSIVLPQAPARYAWEITGVRGRAAGAGAGFTATTFHINLQTSLSSQDGTIISPTRAICGVTRAAGGAGHMVASETGLSLITGEGQQVNVESRIENVTADSIDLTVSAQLVRVR